MSFFSCLIVALIVEVGPEAALTITTVDQGMLRDHFLNMTPVYNGLVTANLNDALIIRCCGLLF